MKQFLLAPTLGSIQFSAILGDLQHKQDLYLGTASFKLSTTCHFSNCEQAGYLLTRHPWLIAREGLNNHSLGTIFEHHYYSNLTFRFAYLQDFSCIPLTCLCVSVPNGENPLDGHCRPQAPHLGPV